MTRSEAAARSIATVASACVCGLLIHHTGGAHGIDWFVVSLVFIW